MIIYSDIKEYLKGKILPHIFVSDNYEFIIEPSDDTYLTNIIAINYFDSCKGPLNAIANHLINLDSNSNSNNTNSLFFIVKIGNDLWFKEDIKAKYDDFINCIKNNKWLTIKYLYMYSDQYLFSITVIVTIDDFDINNLIKLTHYAHLTKYLSQPNYVGIIEKMLEDNECFVENVDKSEIEDYIDQYKQLLYRIKLLIKASKYISGHKYFDTDKIKSKILLDINKLNIEHNDLDLTEAYDIILEHLNKLTQKIYEDMIERIKPQYRNKYMIGGDNKNCTLSTYQIMQHLKNRKGELIEWPKTTETLDKFLARVGYLRHDLEGYIRPQQMREYRQILLDNKSFKRVVEIGFNAGHSTQTFLSVRPNISVLSFDILWHPYTPYAKLYIDNKYPNRHTLIAGDSGKTVEYFASEFLKEPYDLIFIDGDHNYEPALRDIKNMRVYSHPNTLVIIDNVAPHRGCSMQVYDAYLTAIDEGIITHLKHVEVDDYVDGYMICFYNHPKSKYVGQKLDKEFIERRIPVYELTKKITKAKTLEELIDYKKQWEKLANANKDLVDEYSKKELDRKFKELNVNEPN